MELMATVTINTCHPPLTEVNIGLEILVFSQVFIAYTAAVAGGAVAGHGRGCVIVMAIDKSTTD